MNLTKVADASPFAMELLIPDDCFVLDNGLCGKIYIWKGTWASPRQAEAGLLRPHRLILWACPQALGLSFLFPPPNSET